MTLFEAVKHSVTTRQAAEYYHFPINRSGLITCPFHNDHTPSMISIFPTKKQNAKQELRPHKMKSNSTASWKPGAFGCCQITCICSANGKKSMRLSWKTKPGIRCLWRPYRKKITLNICLMCC